jgi:pilus assembly protein Flp/PilA
MRLTNRLFLRYIALQSRVRVWADERGQDLIEYALMAGFVAVAAGAIMPGVATSISTIFSKVASVMSKSATQGS